MVLSESGIKHNVDSRMNILLLSGGHQVYYNFIRPHMSLSGCTPAEIANVNLNLGKRKWEKLLSQSMNFKKS